MSDITILKAKEDEVDEKGIEARLKEEQIKDQARRAREFFSQLQTELDEIEVDLKDGISYLDMKNDTLLSYMIDLCNIILRKVRGETISGHASVERCVAYRVILEKIKAIDQRLAYQLTKVISMPDGAADEDQGINIENLDIEVGSGSDDDNERMNGDANGSDSNENDDTNDDESDEFEGSIDGSEDGDEEQDGHSADNEELKEKLLRQQTLIAKKGKKDRSTSSNTGVYVPPKLRSVAYDGDHSSGGRDRRRRDYSAFYQDDENQDIVDETRTFKDDERTKYEEDNYTRLPDDNPKKAKRKLKTKAMGGKGKKKFKGKRGKW